VTQEEIRREADKIIEMYFDGLITKEDFAVMFVNLAQKLQ